MTLNSSDNKEFVNIKSILKIGFHYWYIFIISGIISSGLGLIYFKVARPVHKFTSNIMVEENKSSGMSSISTAMLRNLPFGDFGSGNVSVYDELQILGAFTTFKETIKQLNLNTTYVIKKFPKDIYCYNNSPLEIKPVIDYADTLKSVLLFKIEATPNKCEIKAYKSGIFNKLIGKTTLTSTTGTISTEYGDFTISPTSFFDPQKKYTLKAMYSGYDLTAELLKEKVEIDLPSKKANLINITTTEYDIVKGKDILNSLVEVYNKRGLKQKQEVANTTIKFLDDRLNVIYKELSDIEESVESYKKQNDLIDIGAEVKAIYANNGEFKKQQLEIETQYAIIKYMEEFVTSPSNKYSLIPLNIGINDSKAMEGLQQYNDALLSRMKLVKNTNENNPTIEISNEQLDAMRVNLLNTIKGVKNGLELTRNKLEEQQKYYETRLKNVPTQEREFKNIARQQYLKQELYMYLLQKREENLLTLSETTPKTQVIDAAYCMYKPVSPKLTFILLGIIFLTCVISISYILLLENYRNIKRE